MTIQLNVGGKIFETTKDTLQQSTYFASLLSRWTFDNNTPYFIDRSNVIFEHVLCLLRDPSYLFPYEYANELDFYGIKYDENSLASDPNTEINKLKIELSECKTYINKLIYTLQCSNIKFINKNIVKCIIPTCNRFDTSNICSHCTYLYNLDTSISFNPQIKTLVMYNGLPYFFRSNGTSCYLYKDIEDVMCPMRAVKSVGRWNVHRPTLQDVKNYLGNSVKCNI